MVVGISTRACTVDELDILAADRTNVMTVIMTFPRFNDNAHERRFGAYAAGRSFRTGGASSVKVHMCRLGTSRPARGFARISISAFIARSSDPVAVLRRIGPGTRRTAGCVDQPAHGLHGPLSVSIPVCARSRTGSVVTSCTSRHASPTHPPFRFRLPSLSHSPPPRPPTRINY